MKIAVLANTFGRLYHIVFAEIPKDINELKDKLKYVNWLKNRNL